MNIKSLTVTEEAQNGFYPTPPALADRLLSGIEWEKVETVLEPSAGKGNIILAAAEKFTASISCYHRERKLNVDCIEIDPYLRSILKYEFSAEVKNELDSRLEVFREKQSYDHTLGRRRELTPSEKREEAAVKKEYERRDRVSLHIIHDDFHTFQSRKQYDLIAMNPPFADGDRHLLQAIMMQCRSGGMIRCILNAETIRNPCTNIRRMLLGKLQNLHAEIEYVDNAFSAGERRTDVAVALIKINIPPREQESVVFDRLRKAAELEEPIQAEVTDLAVTDFIERIIRQFQVEVDAGIELIREYTAMKPHILESFSPQYGNAPILTLCVGDPRKAFNGGPSINKYVRAVRKKYWEALFSNKEFIGRLTSNLREKYRNMVSSMADYDFTLFNIQQIVEQMDSEMGKGIQDTIVALFDKLTQEHAWYPECSKNIHYYNGWKTNKVHKINSKVILPVNGMFSDWAWSKKTFDVHNAENTISDIEKVFDYLDGNETAAVDLHGVLLNACECGQTRNIVCKYFDVTLYKKGTMHIKFRNQELVDKFNIYCCRYKNWLPPSYGKTAYTNLSEEERVVVDGFHGDGTKGAGEAAYTAVVAKAAYFLAEPTHEILALSAPAT